MSNIKHYGLSIDLETLSLESNAAVIQLAAVPFTTLLHCNKYADAALHGIDLFGTAFNDKVWPMSYDTEKYPHTKDFHVDPKTVAWWDTKDEAIRKSVFSGMTLSTQVAKRFVDWVTALQATGYLAQGEELRVYIRNAPFDWKVLKHFLEAEGQQFPFHHRAVREYYSEVDFIPAEVIQSVPANPAFHDAGCDAAHQARVISAAHAYRFGETTWPK